MCNHDTDVSRPTPCRAPWMILQTCVIVPGMEGEMEEAEMEPRVPRLGSLFVILILSQTKSIIFPASNNSPLPLEENQTTITWSSSLASLQTCSHLLDRDLSRGK